MKYSSEGPGRRWALVGVAVLTIGLSACGTSGASPVAEVAGTGSGLNGTLSVVAGADGRDSVFVQAGDDTIVTKKQNADQSFPAG